MPLSDLLAQVPDDPSIRYAQADTDVATSQGVTTVSPSKRSPRDYVFVRFDDQVPFATSSLFVAPVLTRSSPSVNNDSLVSFALTAYGRFLGTLAASLSQ